MKNLDLNAIGVVEMDAEEIVNIDGGGWLRDAWDWLVEHGTGSVDKTKSGDVIVSVGFKLNF